MQGTIVKVFCDCRYWKGMVIDMYYIVFDLEWNQSPDGKDFSREDLPFEIIQIGAVKLNEKFEQISEFNRFVMPLVYQSLHRKVKELLNVTMEEIVDKGGYFVDVFEEFIEWCGNPCIFCTWGSMDLSELQRNMKFYNISYQFEKPFLFYDVQKLYSLCFQDGKQRITLQHAIEALKLPQMEGYHSADNDARYTAQVLALLDMKKVGKFYSVDTFYPPVTRKEEIHLDFGLYEKYISKGFTSREIAASDREVRSCKCFRCKKPAKKIIKWFSTNNRAYYGLFQCQEHGLIKGRIRIKSSDDGQYYAIKIMKLTDETGAQSIKNKREKERERRKMAKLKASKEEKE